MPKRNLIWIVIILAAAVVAAMWMTRRNDRRAAPQRRDLQPLIEMYDRIRRSAYKPVDRETLLEGAVRGMAESLDEYSTFVPREKVEAFNSRLDGRQRGIGLELTRRDGRVLLLGALMGSPAQKTDLRAGDELLAVDGALVARLDVPEIQRRLAGPPGTAVRLTIRPGRAGTPPPASAPLRTVELTREEFALETVVGLYRDGRGEWVYDVDPERGIAYVRIKEFADGAEERFAEVCRRVGRAGGLVIDLRDDPGGRLESAAAVADLLLDGGRIATKVSRDEPEVRYEAHAAGTLPPIPVVVLISDRTASAAEILAGALRYHHRAVLVGTRTRGKGFLQSLLPLGDMGQLNLTTSEILIGPDVPFARRRGATKWGIDPHVEVALSQADRDALAEMYLQEEVILSPPTPTTAPADEDDLRQQKLRQILPLDRPLARAIRILRSPRGVQQILQAARQADRPGGSPTAPYRD